MNGRTVKPGIKEWRSWLLPSAAPCPLLPVLPRPPAAVADDGATQHQSLKKSFAKKLPTKSRESEKNFNASQFCTKDAKTKKSR